MNGVKGGLVIGAGGICIGLLLAAGYFELSPRVLPAYTNSGCSAQYPLTSTLIDCGEYTASSDDLHALDALLDGAVAQYVADGKATRVSIWVRDLNTNQWASTNETENYTPASLLKVPLLITYYKLAEVEPSIMQVPLTYEKVTAQDDSTENFPSEANLVLGQQYTVKQLLQAMMVYSDNNAADVLSAHLGPDTLNTTLVDLGIKVPTQTGVFDFVTVKSYANIFRILYNASYLDRHYSEQALELMSSTTFDGINDPIPSSVDVSHKFGERKVLNPDGSVQDAELHDCGIVYKQPDPYVICIMTEGNNFEDLLSVIKDLSRITYRNI